MGVPTKNIIPLNLYRSIDDMILYNFDRYLATQDLNWFRIDYTGRETKIESEELKKAEETILEEYFLDIEDKTFENKLNKWFKISELEKAYNVLSSLISVMYNGFDDSDEEHKLRIQYIMLLNKGYGSVRFKMPLLNQPCDDRIELDKAFTQLQGIKTRVSLLRDELKEDGKKSKSDLYKELRQVATALGQPIVSDPRVITVKQWNADCKLVREISKNN